MGQVASPRSSAASKKFMTAKLPFRRTISRFFSMVLSFSREDLRPANLFSGRFLYFFQFSKISSELFCPKSLSPSATMQELACVTWGWLKATSCNFFKSFFS